MNTRRFIPHRKLIAGTLAAILWLAVFPFWLLGENTPLNALVSDDVTIFTAFTRLTMQDYSSITRAKWDGMLLLTLLTLLMLPLAYRRHAPRKLPLALMLLFLLWTALSCRFGQFAGRLNAQGLPAFLWGSGRYEGLLTIVCYGLIFLAMRRTDSHLPTLLTVLSAAMAGYLAIVLLQYAGYNPFSLFPSGRSIRTNYEFQGTIGNIDLVSAWVCLLMPGLLGSFVLGHSQHWLHLPGGLCAVLLTLLMDVQSGLIVLALTLLALCLLALRHPDCLPRLLLTLGLTLLLLALRKAILLPWLDFSDEICFAPGRFSLLTALLGALLIAAAPLLMRRLPPAVPKKWLLALLCVLLVGVLTAVALLPTPEGGGVWELHELLNGRAQDSFGSERLGVWRITLEMLRSSPWFGLSPDAFYLTFRDYLDATGQVILQNFDNPHNFFLQTAIASGVPALLLLVLLCGAAILCAWRCPARRPLALMALGFLAQGMFTFSICLTSPMFYCVLGLCAGTSAAHSPFPSDETKEVAHVFQQNVS